MPEGLLIEDLHLSVRAPAGGGPGPSLKAPARDSSISRPVLSGVGLSVAPGEFVALVGASGSGKTMTALSVLGLLPPQIQASSGSISLGGTDLLRASGAELNRLRGGRIGMLYQQPKRMFNPRMTIGNHLAEPLKLHRQYIKNIGRFVELTMNDDSKKEGKLIEANEDSLVIEFTEGKGKKVVTQQLPVALSDIKQTKVQVKF